MSRNIDKVQLVEHGMKDSTNNEANMIDRGQPLDGERENVPIGGLAVDFVGVVKC